MKQTRPITLLVKLGLLAALIYVSHNTVYVRSYKYQKSIVKTTSQQ